MHNFASRAVTAEVPVTAVEELCDVIGSHDPIRVRDGVARVRLARFGYRWFRTE